MRKILLALVHPLARLAGLWVYQYPKADSTATVVLLFDNGRQTVVIERDREPFAGKLAFPSGFLDVDAEDLRRAARRELLEETSIDLPEEFFVSVDNRSTPRRDPRGHVVDHGYVAFVPESQVQQVLRSLRHGSDARAAFPIRVEELLQQEMAFDHRDLLEAALAEYQRVKELRKLHCDLAAARVMLERYATVANSTARARVSKARSDLQVQ